LGNDGGRGLGSGLCYKQRRKVDQGFTVYRIEILIVTRRFSLTLGRNVDVNTGRAEHEARSATWNLGTNSAFVLEPKKNTPVSGRKDQENDDLKEDQN
jgi:hypothetical protein